MSANGHLDTATLTRVDGWAHLFAPTAAAWNAACDEMVRLGYSRPSITAPDGAYRTYAQQVYWKAYWTRRGLPGNAATPGTSNHGWGTDVDIWNVNQFYRPDLVRVFADYGFTFNVPSELWHAHHNGTWPAGIEPTPIPTQSEEDDMKPYLISDGGAWYLCVPGSKMIWISEPVAFEAIKKMLAGHQTFTLDEVRAIERFWSRIPA